MKSDLKRAGLYRYGTRTYIPNATTCRSVTIGSLHPDHQYPVVHAERVNTRYGLVVLIVILENPTTSVLFLPKRYSDVADEDRGHQFKTSVPIPGLKGDMS